ncbi:MAG TPA: SAVED domain-containing protein [Hyphomonadaceae bacterium]|jgi:hypothetical protein|nr:SAVED domain-containing protein [Hyphomonadaceae bacterium]HPN07245.1 SAVED domain-containing protein [Hyphomonadaceae bacterium]
MTAQTQQKPDLLSPARNVPRLVTLQLYARAGGCCEFRGCGKYLLEHAVTKREGNFAEQAHIYAFSDAGPRGEADGRPENIHTFENLMLMCAACHKHIDDQPELFSVATLKAFKHEHEERVRRAILLAPDCETIVVTMTAPIRGAHVSVSRNEVMAAIAPLYPCSSTFVHIDLSDLDGQVEAASFLDVACRKIDREVAKLFDGDGPVSRTPHLSVFAIAPIPLLAYLGARLENKVPLNVFQKHRDTQNWTWKSAGPSFSYVVRCVQEKPRGAPVALVLSLSGTIGLADLPLETRRDAAVYEITVDGVVPQPTFLNRIDDLAGFAPAYHELLGRIAVEHGYVDAIDVFPAVPTPIAVTLGRERLLKRHPALRIHDADKANGGFIFQIEVK